MAKIRDTAEVVKAILEKNEKARDDDNLLICLVVQEYGKIDKLNGGKGFSCNFPFYAILDYINKGKIPTLETITRCRRKTQELYPDLKGKEQVQDARLKKTKYFIEFSQDKRI